MSQDKNLKLQLIFHASFPEPIKDYQLIVLIGKSNVGKSSFVNWLANNKNLAFVSKSPGRTQLLNHYLFIFSQHQYYLIDTPGYGFAKISKEKQLIIQKAIQKLFQLACDRIKLIIFLFDIRQELTTNDLEVYQNFKHFKHLIIFTKYDKINQQKRIAQLKQHLSKLEIKLENQYFLYSKLRVDNNYKQKFLFFLNNHLK